MAKTTYKPWKIAILLLAVAAVLFGATIAYHELFYPGRFGVLVPEQVFHSRQPVGMQWRVLQRHNIKRVINLRQEVEDPDVFRQEQQACQAAGAEFVNIPVSKLLPDEDQIVAFLKAVRGRPGPVLFHCAHGRHRTSFMKACYRVLMDRWPVDQAIAEMTDNNAEPIGEKLTLTQKILNDIRDRREYWLAASAATPTTSTAAAMAVSSRP